MDTRQGCSTLGRAAAVLLACLGAAGCGGGGGGGGEAPAATTRITGSAFAAPVEGGEVTVRNVAGTEIAGPAITAADGSYQIDVPTTALGSELYFSLSGGSFIDEATGQAVSLTGNDRLAAVAAAGALGPGGEIHLTPATTVVCRLVEDHGTTRAEARVRFRNAFGFTPDPSVAPANTDTAPEASCLAGLRAGAFSQLAEDLYSAPGAQFDLLEALSRDLSDRTLDGVDAGGPVTVGSSGELPADIQNCYENALVGFLDNPRNLTGLASDQLGFLAFAKIALTASYRVEYVPVSPGAAVGRTPFQLAITDRVTSDPVAGLAVSVEPLMRMASYSHSTPREPVVEGTDGSGNVAYDGAVYYSMPGGESYGHWSLEVEIDGGGAVETATFHPVVSSLNVNMARLEGQDDQILGELGAEARPYYLSDAGLTPLAGAGYRFDLFVSAREDDHDYPGIAPGIALHDASGAGWTVGEVVVKVSLDNDENDIPDADEDENVFWHTADSAGAGKWSVPELPGIAPDSETLAFFVQLSVNGEQKTANGNDFAKMVMGGASCCD